MGFLSFFSYLILAANFSILICLLFGSLPTAHNTQINFSTLMKFSLFSAARSPNTLLTRFSNIYSLHITHSLIIATPSAANRSFSPIFHYFSSLLARYFLIFSTRDRVELLVLFDYSEFSFLFSPLFSRIIRCFIFLIGMPGSRVCWRFGAVYGAGRVDVATELICYRLVDVLSQYYSMGT